MRSAIVGPLRSAAARLGFWMPEWAFLAGEDAGFITGQTLSVSGGLTMA